MKWVLMLSLLGAGCSSEPPTGSVSVPPAGRRSTVDRPAEVSGPQIHVVYMIPSDGLDRGLDTTGTLERSVERFQAWLTGKTGFRLREDRYQGRLDITFFRSRRTGARIAQFGPYILNALYAELAAAGFDDRMTRYLIYYEGRNPLTCANALQEGPAAAVYLRGSQSRSCARPFETGPGPPGYWEFAMLHEVMHTLGAVHFNAPGHSDSLRWHVADESDLMYGGGDIDWNPEYVDRNGTNYFGDNLPPWIRNVKHNPILVPAQGAGSAPGPWTLSDRVILPAVN